MKWFDKIRRLFGRISSTSEFEVDKNKMSPFVGGFLKVKQGKVVTLCTFRRHRVDNSKVTRVEGDRVFVRPLREYEGWK